MVAGWLVIVVAALVVVAIGAAVAVYFSNRPGGGDGL